MKPFRWILGAWVLIGLLGAAAPLQAQVINFNMTMVGVSTTLTGEMFDFTATGAGTLDPMTGQFSFNVTTSAGVTFTGDGIMGIGPTGLAFATTTLQSLDPVSTGTAVIDGQINVDTLELTGNIVAGIPATSTASDRLLLVSSIRPALSPPPLPRSNSLKPTTENGRS